MNSRLPTLVTEDERFRYKGIGGQPSTCRLQLFNSATTGGVVAVVTELDANEGSSVTNCVVSLATEITERFEVEPERLTLIEHYPEERRGAAVFDASFSRVNLKHTRRGFEKESPAWSPLGVQEVANLTGTPVEEWERAPEYADA